MVYSKVMAFIPFFKIVRNLLMPLSKNSLFEFGFLFVKISVTATNSDYIGYGSNNQFYAMIRQNYYFFRDLCIRLQCKEFGNHFQL